MYCRFVVLLSLFAACSAAPQYYYGGGYQYPVYPVYPQYGNSYPVYPQYYPGSEVAATRGLFTIPSFMSEKADLSTGTAIATQVAPLATTTTVSGSVEFKQNPFTGDNSVYNVSSSYSDF